MKTPLMTGIFLALACCVAAGAAAPQAAKFRVIYQGGPYGIPTRIAQVTPELFLWDTRYAIYSIDKRGGIAGPFASAPSGCTICGLTAPVPAANGRQYAYLAGDSNNPSHLLSFDLKLNGSRDYAQQALTPNGPLSNLPDGKLLGLAPSGTGYYAVITDLEGSSTAINYDFPGLGNAAGPIYASDGNYYGALSPQGQSSYLYRLTPAGVFTHVANTPSSANPQYLVQGADGNFYGLTAYAGAGGYGAFYQVTMAGRYTLLYSFAKSNPNPGALVQASDGNFYGITNVTAVPPRGGELFQLTTAGQYTAIHKINGHEGQAWFTSLIQGDDGVLYGTATAGGDYGSGTIFAVDLGLPKPAPRALDFSPAQGRPGDKVRIWGYQLLGAAVTFGGVAAADVKNAGPNYVWATVPKGAKSGPLVITTPGGSSTTTAGFTVR